MLRSTPPRPRPSITATTTRVDRPAPFPRAEPRPIGVAEPDRESARKLGVASASLPSATSARSHPRRSPLDVQIHAKATPTDGGPPRRPQGTALRQRPALDAEGTATERARSPEGGAPRATPPTFRAIFREELGAQGGLRMRLRSNWSNCGLTAQGIIQKLTPLGLSAPSRHAFSGTRPQHADQLRDLLRAPVDQYTQYNVTIDGIHEFTIDKTPRGDTRLTQGYQGQYSSFFWEGITDETGLRPEDDAIIRRLRDDHAGDGFDIGTFAREISRFLAVGTWRGEGLAERWAALPLAPTDRTPTAARAREQTANPIGITVDVRTIADPNRAARALGGRDGDFLSPLVVKGAAHSLGVRAR